VLPIHKQARNMNTPVVKTQSDETTARERELNTRRASVTDTTNGIPVNPAALPRSPRNLEFDLEPMADTPPRN
jgi:hypothetical protein